MNLLIGIDWILAGLLTMGGGDWGILPCAPLGKGSHTVVVAAL